MFSDFRAIINNRYIFKENDLTTIFNKFLDFCPKTIFSSNKTETD